MRTRFKTYGEFLNQIAIIHRKDGGIVIACRLKKYVLIKTTFRLWNTPQTKTSYLVKLYIDEILKKKDLSKKIKRIDNYELLGARCKYRNDVCIIADAVQVVDTETGEVDYRILVKNITNPFVNNPFKILKSTVQL